MSETVPAIQWFHMPDHIDAASDNQFHQPEMIKRGARSGGIFLHHPLTADNCHGPISIALYSLPLHNLPLLDSEHKHHGFPARTLLPSPGTSQ